MNSRVKCNEYGGAWWVPQQSSTLRSGMLPFFHIFVWGSCFWLCTPACLLLLLLVLLPPSPHTQLTHTQLAHTQLPHTQLAHTQLVHTHTTSSHTTSPHITYSHTLSTHNLFTQNLHKFNLSTHTHTTWPHTTCSHTSSSHTTCPHTTYSHTHTTCPHTTSHTQLTHTHDLLTHNLSTHTHNLLTHIEHTQLTHTHNLSAHTQLAHTQLVHLTHNLLTHNLFTHNLLTYNLFTQNLFTHNLFTHTTYSHTTYSHTHNLLTHNLLTHNSHTNTTYWQVTSTFTLRGGRGTYGTGLALLARLGPVWRRCHRGCLCGKHGTWWHSPSLRVARVALGDIDLHFAGQVWHLWHWAGSGGAPGSRANWNEKNTKSKRGAWKSNRLEVLHLSRWFTHIHTYRYIHKQLSHTQVFHTYLSPSHVSCLPFPFRLHLAFVTCWKKLTCGVIRSFNCMCIYIYICTRSIKKTYYILYCIYSIYAIICIHACMHVFKSCIYIYIHTCVYIKILMYILIWIYICKWYTFKSIQKSSIVLSQQYP